MSDWPITVVAHWRYPGYNRRDMEITGIWLIGSLWLGAASFVTRGEVNSRLVVLVAIVVAYLVWPWVRRRPAEYEMVLEPDRLRVREASAGTPAITMSRGDPGELFVAEAGFDWRERWLSLRTSADRDVVHLRAGNAAVRFNGLDAVTDAWWDAYMPPGTSRRAPPAALQVTPLLGTWWGRERRWSLRRHSTTRHAWKEPDVRGFPAWDRRQRRNAGLAVIGVITFGFVLITVLGSGGWTIADLVTVGPPVLAAFVLGVRSALG